MSHIYYSPQSSYSFIYSFSSTRYWNCATDAHWTVTVLRTVLKLKLDCILCIMYSSIIVSGILTTSILMVPTVYKLSMQSEIPCYSSVIQFSYSTVLNAVYWNCTENCNCNWILYYQHAWHWLGLVEYATDIMTAVPVAVYQSCSTVTVQYTVPVPVLSSSSSIWNWMPLNATDATDAPDATETVYGTVYCTTDTMRHSAT